MRRLKAFFALTIVLVSVCGAGTSLADSYEDRRLRTGAKLFRALLAADLGLQQRVGADGLLQVLVVTDDPDTASEVAKLIEGRGDSNASMIQGIPLAIEFSSRLDARNAPLGGVFIASNVDTRNVAQIAQWGIEQATIVYSPYEGHVEQGVLAGLSVEARVRPFLNRRTLEASGIRLKPFFLQVSRIHE
jgi:hypothetical protein